MTTNWTPQTIAPSGRYGFLRVSPASWEKRDEAVVVLVQSFDSGAWGPTPARFYASQVVQFSDVLAIDLGQQWILSAEDTAAFAPFAAKVELDSLLGR